MSHWVIKISLKRNEKKKKKQSLNKEIETSSKEREDVKNQMETFEVEKTVTEIKIQQVVSTVKWKEQSK